jgi:hypothetical protein
MKFIFPHKTDIIGWAAFIMGIIGTLIGIYAVVVDVLIKGPVKNL